MSWADEIRNEQAREAKIQRDRGDRDEAMKAETMIDFRHNMGVAASEFAAAATDLGLKPNNGRRIGPRWVVVLDSDTSSMRAHGDYPQVDMFGVSIGRDGSWRFNTPGKDRLAGIPSLQPGQGPAEKYRDIDTLTADLKSRLKGFPR